MKQFLLILLTAVFLFSCADAAQIAEEEDEDEAYVKEDAEYDFIPSTDIYGCAGYIAQGNTAIIAHEIFNFEVTNTLFWNFPEKDTNTYSLKSSNGDGGKIAYTNFNGNVNFAAKKKFMGTALVKCSGWQSSQPYIEWAITNLNNARYAYMRLAFRNLPVYTRVSIFVNMTDHHARIICSDGVERTVNLIGDAGGWFYSGYQGTDYIHIRMSNDLTTLTSGNYKIRTELFSTGIPQTVKAVDLGLVVQ